MWLTCSTVWALGGKYLVKKTTKIFQGAQGTTGLKGASIGKISNSNLGYLLGSPKEIFKNTLFRPPPQRFLFHCGVG